MQENLPSGFPTRSDTNQAERPQKMVYRGLKFRIKKVEGLYYLCSKKKGADQLLCNHADRLHLFFAYAKIKFSHEAAQNHALDDAYNHLGQGTKSGTVDSEIFA